MVRLVTSVNSIDSPGISRTCAGSSVTTKVTSLFTWSSAFAAGALKASAPRARDIAARSPVNGRIIFVMGAVKRMRARWSTDAARIPLQALDASRGRNRRSPRENR